MNKKSTRALLAAFGVTGVLGAALLTTRAQGGPKETPAPTGKITPWAALKIATAKVPGHALNANFEFAEGHWVYAVMVVTNTTPKTIKEVEIDPNTGKVGDMEDVTPEDEAKEVTAELNKALGKTTGAKETDAKGEKDEKPEKK